MKKFFIFSTSVAFLATVLTFSSNLMADDMSSPKTIIGQVTLVDQNMLKIKEDLTQTEYSFNASRDQLKNVSTGYRAEVKTDNGKISSLIVLGMPMKAEPEPFQKWKVIKYPQG